MVGTFEDTPISRIMQVLGGKYKIYIIWRLMDEPMRFGELHAFFKGVTAHILLPLGEEKEWKSCASCSSTTRS